MKTIEERFYAKTKPVGGCLEWQAAIKKPSKRDFSAGGQSLPHGVFWYQGRTEPAHRVAVALELRVEARELPLVGHMCDNPRCVRFTHLEPSSFSQNLKDAWDRGRRPERLAQNLVDLCAWFDQRGKEGDLNEISAEQAGVLVADEGVRESGDSARDHQDRWRAVLDALLSEREGEHSRAG